MNKNVLAMIVVVGFGSAQIDYAMPTSECNRSYPHGTIIGPKGERSSANSGNKGGGNQGGNKGSGNKGGGNQGGNKGGGNKGAGVKEASKFIELYSM